ncbi:RHS repeat-associated core domain-containing protein, partial [bacterium]|nr:RHS repeat-associated core domain-containing protein [bacterium]
YVGEYFEQVAPEPDKWETWLQQRGVDPDAPPEDTPGLDTEKKAAVRTLPHANTPTITFLDSLGRTFFTIAHNKFERRTNGAVAIIEENYSTRVVFDIEGNQREVIDAKDRIVMCYDYDMLGSPIHQASMEAGERWMLNNLAGNPIRAWDSRGFQRRMTFDVLQRPLELFVTETNGAEFLAEKIEYGESKPDPEMTNHRSKPWKVYDGAGVVFSESFDFKGNLLTSTRQLLSDYISQVNWTLNPQLETETFTSSITYDALNRPIQVIAPHSSRVGTKLNVIQPVYNEANLLESEDVWLEQDAEPGGLLDPDTATQHFVTNIDYNAKGQRELIEYGNGVLTQYEYDPVTFRLIHMQTLRETGGLQDMFYTYDPAGNITAIRDDAQQTIYFNGQVVKPDADYKYDAIYRLIQSHGREHIGQASQPQTTWNDKFRVNLAHPNDGQAMRNYFEFYDYDEVGNILCFDHKANSGNWIRAYDYDEMSLIETNKNNNRLSQTIVHPDGQQPIPEPYTHDSHGNMTSMPHLSQMEWDFEDQLHHVEKGNVMAYYIYDAAGERVRKVVEKNGGTLIEERIYLGGFEIYRKLKGSGIVLERETLHIMDDQQRIAMVETRTIDTQDVDQAPRQLVRYQFGNHLGSASLELDDRAQVISYEEYYPYGSTSYQARRNQTETPKRYRYTGKERDEETGLNYHGARYYAPWLGRWASADPIGVNGGINVYAYVHNNPICRNDPNGTQERDGPQAGFGFRLDTGGNFRLGPWDTLGLCDDLNPAYRPWLDINLSGTEIEYRKSISIGESGSLEELGLANEAKDVPSKVSEVPHTRSIQAPEKTDDSQESKPFGAYLPLTEAGEEAAMYYSDLVVEGENQGGFVGFMKQVGGWTGGLFASLWTPETAVETAFTLATAGIGTSAQGARFGGGLMTGLKEGTKLAIRGPWRVFGNTPKLLKDLGLKYGFRNLAWDPRNFKAVSIQYWRISGGANHKALHHLFFKRVPKWIPKKWIPKGFRNAGFNLLEMPLGLHEWIHLSLAAELGFRLTVGAILGAIGYGSYRITRWITEP